MCLLELRRLSEMRVCKPPSRYPWEPPPGPGHSLQPTPQAAAAGTPPPPPAEEAAHLDWPQPGASEGAGLSNNDTKRRNAPLGIRTSYP